MDTLKYIAKKYKLNLASRAPIEIPKVSRDGLAKLFSELGFTKGAEVGTWTGAYTAQLCGANKNTKLIGVDLNSKTPRRIVPQNCKLIKMSSLDAAKKVVDNSLDFVYLDTNSNLAATLTDLTEWSKKVRVGGIIAGHDFFRHRPQNNVHTREGILVYTSTYKINPLFVVGYPNDRIRSWFWVKA